MKLRDSDLEFLEIAENSSESVCEHHRSNFNTVRLDDENSESSNTSNDNSLDDPLDISLESPSTDGSKETKDIGPEGQLPTKFSYTTKDSGIGEELLFDANDPEITEDISFETNGVGDEEEGILKALVIENGKVENLYLKKNNGVNQGETSFETKNGSNQEKSTSEIKDCRLTEGFGSKPLLYKTATEDDASTFKTQNSSQNLSDEHPIMKSDQENLDIPSDPCSDRLATLYCREEYPENPTLAKDDILMENINLSIDQLYSAAKYEVERREYKLTDTDSSIYSEEETRIEEDIIITDLDSVSNRCTPNPGASLGVYNREGIESPRKEPEMQVQVQNKNTFEFKDTPRTVLTENEIEKSSRECYGSDMSGSFQDKVRDAILTIEHEESKTNQKKMENKTDAEKEGGDGAGGTDKEEGALSDEELDKLKRKCLDRLEKSRFRPESQDYTANSSIQDFSNSQKLLRFLQESEEKDEQTKNKVKTASYNMHPDIPKLGDLLTKSVADLSEEVLNLNLGNYNNNHNNNKNNNINNYIIKNTYININSIDNNNIINDNINN